MTKWLDKGQMTGRQMLDIPPVWMLGALVLIWAQARGLPGWTWPLGAGRGLGVVLAVCGVAVALWAGMAFRKHQTSVVPHQVPQALITSGPFRFSRNPIYLGDALVLLGAVLWFGAWPSLGVVAGFVILINRRFIAAEERRLARQFPQAFAAYAAKTRRWI